MDEVLTSVGTEQRETLRRVSPAESLPSGLAVELAEHEDAADVLDDLVPRSTGLVTGTGADRAPSTGSASSCARPRRGPGPSRIRPRVAGAPARGPLVVGPGPAARGGRPGRADGDPDSWPNSSGQWAPGPVARGEYVALERAFAAVGERGTADLRLAMAAADVARAGDAEGAAGVPAARAASWTRAGRGRRRRVRTATERWPACTDRSRPPSRSADPAVAALDRVGRGAAALVGDPHARGTKPGRSRARPGPGAGPPRLPGHRASSPRGAVVGR